MKSMMPSQYIDFRRFRDVQPIFEAPCKRMRFRFRRRAILHCFSSHVHTKMLFIERFENPSSFLEGECARTTKCLLETSRGIILSVTFRFLL